MSSDLIAAENLAKAIRQVAKNARAGEDLRVRGEGAATPKEATARHITKTLTTFRPGKLFKDILDGITFEKV